jgi:hypothetical protein
MDYKFNHPIIEYLKTESNLLYKCNCNILYCTHYRSCNCIYTSSYNACNTIVDDYPIFYLEITHK